MGKPGLAARPNCSWKSTSHVVVLSTMSSCLTQMLCCRVCRHTEPHLPHGMGTAMGQTMLGLGIATINSALEGLGG